jgi:hypothetical protein
MKLPIVEGTIDHLLLCAMAQIGAATTDEIVTEIHSYTDGKDVSQEEIESTLNRFAFLGEATRSDSGSWLLCPIEESAFDYDE